MLERWLKPRIENPDPKVRAEALLQLDADSPIFLEALRSDEAPQVRAQLLAKTTDLALLQARAREDEDATAAAAAAARLRALLGAGDDIDEAARTAFVDALRDGDLLAHVAGNGASVTLRRLALARHREAADDHETLLVAVAGGDDDPALRREALAQLSRLDDLEQVAAATRKADKHLYKEVRDKIRALRQQAERAQAGERLAQEIAQLAQQAVAARSDDMHRAVALLQNWREVWTPLVEAGDAPLPDVAAQVGAVEERIERARTIIAQREQILAGLVAETAGAAAEPDWQAQWDALPDHTQAEEKGFAEALKKRRSRVRQVADKDAALGSAERFLQEHEGREDVSPRRLAHVEKTWATLSVPAGERGQALQARYDALRDALAAGVEAAQAAQAKAAKGAGKLLEKLAAALDAGQLGPASSAHDKLTHQLGQKDLLAAAAATGLRKRLAVLAPKYRELKEARGWSTRQARENLTQEAETLAATASEQEPTELAKRVRALRAQWQELDRGVGPAVQEAWERFDTACKTAYAPAKEHFSEGAAKRRALCERLETFFKEHDWAAPDWGGVVKLVRDTRKAWREAGQVEYKKFQKLRKRFDAAVSPLDEKLGEEQERDVRRRKLAIGTLQKCVERDPLDAQIEMAKKVQREWRPTVRGRRKEEQSLWDELRKICDDIFARRDAKFSDRREAEDGALAAKTTLCEEIDALLPGDEAIDDDAVVNQAKGQFQALRVQWRDAGDVGPKKKSAAQGRYRAACERFEKRLRQCQRHSAARAVDAQIERVLLLDRQREALADGGDPDALRAEWEALPPLRGALGKKFAAAFDAAPAPAAGAHLAAKRELCLRAELAAGVPSPPQFEQERMALKIAQLKDALGGGGASASGDAIGQFTEQWIALGPAGADEAAALRERFALALRALAAAQ